MKKFLFLTIGFTKPTPAIMSAWGKWLDSIKTRIVDQGGVSVGRKITHDGTKDLPSMAVFMLYGR